jgi:YfiH family protein
LQESIQINFFDKTFKEIDGVYSPVDSLQAQRNRFLVVKRLDVTHLLLLKQVHGKRVVDADLIEDFSKDPEADGAVTTKKRLALGIQTADCVPVLLYSDENHVIGVAHCGWRGAQLNLLREVVELMQKKGAFKIKAILGPSIKKESYEVDEVFYEAILKENFLAKELFLPSLKPFKFLFDLPGFVILKLNELGIKEISISEEDTYKMSEKYESYRRDTHQGTTRNGRNLLSTIMIAH